MPYFQYKHFTFVYILIITLISHVPGDNLPEYNSSLSHQDKIFHFCEFFILGLLVQLSFIEAKLFSNKEIIFMSLIFCFTIACFDELHQNFVQGRNPSIDDLFFDFFGIILSFINHKRFY